MANQLFVSPFIPAFNLPGTLEAGAQFFFYKTGTTDLADIFDDNGDALDNPVIADEQGRFPGIFLGETQAYYLRLETALGTLIDEVDPYLANPTGFSQATTYAQGTIGNHLKRFVTITDAPYNAKGDGVTDDSAAFTAALSDLASGGTLWIPFGVFRKTVSHALPANIVIAGAGSKLSTTILQDGTGYAFTTTDAFFIKDLLFSGGSNATGAINLDGTGFSMCQNVFFQDFTAINAIAYKTHNGQRNLLSHCYFYNNYNHVDFRGYNTTFEAYKCEFAVSNASGHALYGPNTGDPQEQINARFRSCYFESLYGPGPIYFGQFGSISFEDCGFEEMCTSAGFVGTIASPKSIQCDNPTRLYITRCEFSDFRGDKQTYSGTMNHVYLGNDAPWLSFTDNLIIQNVTTSGGTLNAIRQAGSTTVLSLVNNRFIGGNYANTLEVERAFISGISNTGTVNLYAENCIMDKPGTNTRTFSRRPSILSNSANVSTTGTTLTPFMTYTFPRNSFRNRGESIKITIFGTRTGAAGTKLVTLDVIAGTTTTYNITSAAAAADNWKAEIIIKFEAYNSQSISILGIDALAVTVNNSVLATKDTATNDLTLTVNGQCSNAGDIITAISYDLVVL